MPLLLASTFQHFKNLKKFEYFLRKSKVACITTAALCQIEDNTERPEWMNAEINAIQSLSQYFFEYDLRNKKTDDLKHDLLECDLIYFIGGNTYCLLEAINKSGYRDFVPQFLNKGKSVWGGSAGAIVQCPDIDYIRSMDEPEKSSLKDFRGLKLTDLYIIPHWESSHQEQAIKSIQDNSHLDLICVTDEQAIYIEDNKIEIL